MKKAIGFLKKELIDNYVRLRSYSTQKKILVIESDDWGSIRMPNRQVRAKLNEIGPLIRDDNFCQMDSLANCNDLNALLELFTDLEQETSKKPVLTMNVCTANPDFVKIEQNDFNEFFYEPFFSTIGRLNEGKQILQLWNIGVSGGMLRPQLHGREHVNGIAWLDEIRLGNKELKKAFDYGVYGIPVKKIGLSHRSNFQAALDHTLKNDKEIDYTRKWLEDGARIFEDFFGFQSDTFIAPAYIWHKDLNQVLSGIGVLATQGIRYQYSPIENGYKKYKRYTGNFDDNQFQLVRNVFFEPSNRPQVDWVSDAKKRIKKAFDTNQPAIIGSHRINFIGSLNEENRRKNLEKFGELLKWVIREWRNVEFMSSDELLHDIQISKSVQV